MDYNEKRAIRARTALLAHYTADDEIVDLLTNLMHLCQRDDIDFTECLQLAAMHFEAQISVEV